METCISALILCVIDIHNVSIVHDRLQTGAIYTPISGVEQHKFH